MTDERRRSLKILVLCKRQYTGKDLLDDKYGRLWEVPLGLADLGHEVTGITLSYRRRREGAFTGISLKGKGRVLWQSVNLGLFLIPGAIKYLRTVRRHVAEFKPDVVLAMSDAFHVIYGRRLAKSIGTQFIADLYDNFESFGGTKMPGIRNAFIKAVAAADKVVCVSSPLTEYVSAEYRCQGKIFTIENGFDAQSFRPLDKAACRKRLGLSESAKIVGTAGAISKSRDIQTLLSAAGRLASRFPNLELAVAGRIDTDLVWPSNVRVHRFLDLPHAEVPYFLNALDVAVVPNRDSEFGRYCFPTKAAEILACDVPMTAASVGVMQLMFKQRPDLLYVPGDIEQLVDRLDKLLRGATKSGVKAKTWSEIANDYNRMLAD